MEKGHAHIRIHAIPMETQDLHLDEYGRLEGLILRNRLCEEQMPRLEQCMVDLSKRGDLSHDA